MTRKASSNPGRAVSVTGNPYMSRILELPHPEPARKDRNHRPLTDESETVPVRCWCEKTLIKVSLADINIGLTGPCQRSYCISMDSRRRGK